MNSSKTKDSNSRSLHDEERERDTERETEVHAKHAGIGGNVLIDLEGT